MRLRIKPVYIKKIKAMLLAAGHTEEELKDLCLRCKIIGCPGTAHCIFESNVFALASGGCESVVPTQPRTALVPAVCTPCTCVFLHI